MSLSDLPASELARLDAVCMEYESMLRVGKSPDIDKLVADHGGAYESLLRRELELVRDEIVSNHDTRPMTGPTRYDPGDVDGDSLPKANTTIGHFLVQELIGRGGMGMVFSAVDKRLDRRVAIKMLGVPAADRKELSERFDREARALAALSHPNIVELFDVGVFNGLPYAVMEYLDGELLSTRLEADPLKPDEIRSLGASIADALAAAHEADVVHRDLKPENIMLLKRIQRSSDSDVPEETRQPTSGGWIAVKLFDFGLSRAPLDGFADSDYPALQGGSDHSKTREGVILGTPGYMAPEQARGEKVTPLADIFSLGCILFEAFYGHRPFEGRTYAKRFAATLHHQPDTDPERRLVDRDLANLIDRCLAKNPSERPQSAIEIATSLRHRPRGRSTVDDQNNRRQWMIAGSVAIAAAAAIPLWMGRRGEILNDIQSLAVLSIVYVEEDGNDDEASATDANKSIQEDSEQLPAPIGTAPLDPGEQISAMLVHELTRLSDLSVPRFRPLVAETPEQFRSLGAELDVDAMLTGTLRRIRQGELTFAEIDLQIISSETGNQLWGRRLQSDTPDNLLQQSKLAKDIAMVIGQRLTSTADESEPPSYDKFGCLVDGEARSDPDSPEGLQMALMCFEKAKEIDRRFIEPLEGVALTSITLAAQSDSERAAELIEQSRTHVDAALKIDKASIDARLAQAMLDWQTVGRFDGAERAIGELAIVAPNHWQVHHQLGLLLLTLGKTRDAFRSFQEAQSLNSVSVIARVDLARARWINGDTQRAISDTKRVAKKFKANALAHGLLVDIYEQLEQYEQAAAILGIENTNVSQRSDYFRVRETTLAELPYGPFGADCNAAILQSRLGELDEEAVAILIDSSLPMLRYLLAVHPAFDRARQLERVKEVLP
ncbi:MAG: protein kinase [Planctomycetota bacterium]